MNRSLRARRVGRTAALLISLGWVVLASRPAAAQLGVQITSPANGSTVGGSITVTASVSDPLGTTQGVQFQLDGANLGAEDTSAPYAVPWDTRTASNASHVLRAVARGPLGVSIISDPVTVTVFNDTTPPAVAITAPSSGATVTGTIAVSANASDNVGVVGVQFRLDGAPLGTEDTTNPYSVPWNTTTASPGTHQLTAVARDAAGNAATSAVITVTVPDSTQPTVSITSPSSGATVNGTITVSANASDNVGVVGVQFRLDGAPLGTEDTTNPYSVAWNTTTASPGPHQLTAVARDAAGNTATSAVVTVTVPDNTQPTVSITSPSSGATVNGTITVSANASDNVGVVGVQFRLDGAPLGTEDTTNPYSVAWDTTSAANGSHTLTAVARDAAGNTRTASPVTVTVSNDTVPPTISITAPSSGATVSGTIAVSANAADNVGVVGVQFRLDGAPLGTEDTTNPYSVAWDTTGATNGSHTLTAVARDAAGNTRTASAVTVTVSNDAVPPTVSITAPSSGATVSGTIAVSASASDNVGVVGVQFRLDGAPLGTEDTTNPYSVAWDTTGATNGSHTLTAVARDAAGNTTTASAVTVTVANDTVPPTVSVTAPSSGATVSGTTAVSANASDNVGVVGVQFRLDGAPLDAEDTTSPYSVQWDTRTATDGTHTLTAVARDAAGNTTTSSSITVTVSNTGVGRGDVFVGLLDGRVQRHSPDGTLQGMLVTGSDGEASGLAFDAAGLLYVPHWFSKTALAPGNMVERFDINLNPMGIFGSGYNCNPSSLAFDPAGNVYVGQADCTGDILKLNAAGTPVAAFDAATGVRGADHIDLASDGCTMFYSNWTKDVMRFDVCTNMQLPKFNTQPLPGDTMFHLRILPDGGVLVADSQLIVRLDAFGNQIQTYFVLTESNWWTGLDISLDGTFWANNLATGNVFKFDLASGNVLTTFNAGAPWTVVGIAIKP